MKNEKMCEGKRGVRMKLEEEIKKILRRVIQGVCAGYEAGMKFRTYEEKNIEYGVKEIKKIFRSYVRSLVPDTLKVKKLPNEDAYDYGHRVFQIIREEMLRRIEKV
jgi:hypothetical protein